MSLRSRPVELGVLLLACAILASACSRSSSSEPRPPTSSTARRNSTGTRTFTGQGWSISYPAGWRVQPFDLAVGQGSERSSGVIVSNLSAPLSVAGPVTSTKFGLPNWNVPPTTPANAELVEFGSANGVFPSPSNGGTPLPMTSDYMLNGSGESGR